MSKAYQSTSPFYSCEKLSPREKECLYWISKGKTAEETGMILNLTQKTVENYLGIIRKKLNVHKTLQAVLRAIELELICR